MFLNSISCNDIVTKKTRPTVQPLHIVLLVVFFLVMIWSLIDNAGYGIWVLEAGPALIGLVVLVLTYKRFRLSDFLYVLILIHMIVLLVGAHYTYAEMPLFDWLKEVFGWSRNNYDKVGHFLQGFTPALVARELFIRRKTVPSSGWRNFFIVCICLAISAVYELIEWWVALLTGSVGDAFLGTQGYIWDTQSDMLLALVGAVVALILFSRVQDASMRKLA